MLWIVVSLGRRKGVRVEETVSVEETVAGTVVLVGRPGPGQDRANHRLQPTRVRPAEPYRSPTKPLHARSTRNGRWSK